MLSGWQDSNLRPPPPKAGAIPGYATPRTANFFLLIIIKLPFQLICLGVAEWSTEALNIFFHHLDPPEISGPIDYFWVLPTSGQTISTSETTLFNSTPNIDAYGTF